MKLRITWVVRAGFLLLATGAIGWMLWTDPRRHPPSVEASLKDSGAVKESLGSSIQEEPIQDVPCRDLYIKAGWSEVDTNRSEGPTADSVPMLPPSSLWYRLREGRRMISLDSGGCWLDKGDPIEVFGSRSSGRYVDIYTDGKGFFGNDHPRGEEVPIEQQADGRFGRWLSVRVGSRVGEVFSAGLDPIDPLQQIEGFDLLEKLPGYWVHCRQPPTDDPCPLVYDGGVGWESIELARTPFQAFRAGLEWKSLDNRQKARALSPLWIEGDDLGGPTFKVIERVRQEAGEFVIELSGPLILEGETSEREIHSERRIVPEDGLWRYEGGPWPVQTLVESGKMLEHRIMESDGVEEFHEADRCVHGCR